MSAAASTAIGATEFDEVTVGKAVLRGVTFGVPIVFAIVTLVALWGGVGIVAAMTTAALPALVAGPYFGTLVAVSAEEEHCVPPEARSFGHFHAEEHSLSKAA